MDPLPTFFGTCGFSQLWEQTTLELLSDAFSVVMHGTSYPSSKVLLIVVGGGVAFIP